MTLNVFSGMSGHGLISLLIKASLVALMFFIFTSASATNTGNRAYDNSVTPFLEWFNEQVHSYENETWEQRIRRLMRSNLERLGGERKALADKQVQCLAENIYYESRGESLQGQIAVAKVTLTRVAEGFAKTVCGVVKQGCQFEWVCRQPLSRPGGEPWMQAIGIAVLTINDGDRVEDPTNGATHFHATYINWQPGWKRVKDSVNKIGNHIFYRVNPKEAK